MFYPRIIRAKLSTALKYFPAVFLTGARQVGKSTLALSMFENYITLDDTTVYSSALADPPLFISNLRKPVVIDEIQKLPELLSSIKLDIDKNRVNGSYLLTGSANILALKGISESLAGRMAIVELFPLSCKEIAGKHDDIVEILFNPDFKDFTLPSIETDLVIEQIIKGGYPEIQKIDTVMGRYLWFSSYIRTYIERDIRDLGDLRNLDKFIKMFNLLGPRSANLLNKSELARDAQLEIKTLENYLNLLKTVYQTHVLSPYSRNISKRIVKAQKIFFTDSGILSHLLGVSTKEAFMESPYKGLIFETFVFSEILKAVKYSDKPTELYFYRTFDRHEIDFIIEQGRSIVAIKVKFSKTVTWDDFKYIASLDKAVENLKAGYVIYMGDRILPFGEKFFALPVSIFFDLKWKHHARF
ncbi:ATP-binding protein [Thermodesulfovibrio yellowstonii]|uniref:ATPase n=1 Tax=Thermodesulfovibrio yellowstonii TaxID=28262 RepID=A0A9W6LJ91_9BACT|nr:ATP-binding protein [Thermodesulfovibrio islandicus]GLI52442.1 ATPase [Thermodesulfovibrio islandicus]